jgi:hypothetical protein
MVREGRQTQIRASAESRLALHSAWPQAEHNIVLISRAVLVANVTSFDHHRRSQSPLVCCQHQSLCCDKIALCKGACQKTITGSFQSRQPLFNFKDSVNYNLISAQN